MQKLKFQVSSQMLAAGTQAKAIVGVVASGNLEVLVERTLQSNVCSIEVATTVVGFEEIWQAVIADFVARSGTGGLRISINDCGARPDVVSLRLAQGLRLMDGDQRA
jgi:malonate decarboxylase delta subunit